MSDDDATTAQLADVLRRYWGYDSFRPLQLEAMRCVLADRDSVVVLPTGGGKSLCFQAPALCRDGLALVVSPLISLMKDQVDALQSCGVPAAFVNSTVSFEERRIIANQVRDGEIRLLYMAPERLLSDRTLDFLRQSNLTFLAIDEAHCISEWGHDFRPEYRQLKRLKEEFPDAAIHAYTATATPRVRDDIARNLGLQNAEMLVGSFDRPNLVYKIEQRGDLTKQIRQVIDRHKGESGIIYCLRRADVDGTSELLNGYGYRTLPYHAGMSDEDRKANQDAFINDETDIIVATVAFGMGIDKPNVRFVVHAGMPKSLENYQQESGRAGRDGLEAECVLIYSGQDLGTGKWMISELEGDAFKAAEESLNKIYNYCAGVACRHQSLVQHFGQQYDKPNCGACDVCLGDFEPVDEPLVLGQKILSCVIRLEQQFGADYTMQVLAGSQGKRILENRHDKLSTYGLLKEEDRRHIREWIEQLVGQRFLDKVGEYNQLHVTERGWQVLRGEMSPKLLKPKTVEKKKSKSRRSRAAADSWAGVDEELFEVLRELRTATAREKGLPPYVVFGDAALRDMARRRPTSDAGFLEVRGVGEKKRTDYGDLFLDAIRTYCAEHDQTTDVTPDEQAMVAEPIETSLSQSEARAIQLFESGKSIEDVAAEMGRAQSTTWGYLNAYLQEHAVTDPSPWVDVATVERIEAAIGEVGPHPLRPIYEQLGEDADYNAIRVVATCWENREARAE